MHRKATTTILGFVLAALAVTGRMLFVALEQKISASWDEIGFTPIINTTLTTKQQQAPQPKPSSQPSLPQSAPPSKSKPSVAHAISLTSCPIGTNTSTAAALDGAAILAHSIHRVRQGQVPPSRYDYTLYAFVHPEAVACQHHLSLLGYQVLVRDTPFLPSEIHSIRFRHLVDEQGCCGRREFLKLWAYTLEDHDIVVHTDADVLFFQPLDGLFDAMLGLDSDMPVPFQHATNATNSSTTPARRIDFAYTRDYLQASRFHTDPTKYGVQGGFYAVRPNRTVFEQMISILREGQYSSDKGWAYQGYGGFWGAAQIQGFLSYFYGEVQPQYAVEMDRCRINTMITDDPYFKDGKTCRTGEKTCQDCRETPLDEMISVHMTTCWKPWIVRT